MKDKNRIQCKKNVKETLALVFISTDFAALLIQTGISLKWRDTVTLNTEANRPHNALTPVAQVITRKLSSFLCVRTSDVTCNDLLAGDLLKVSEIFLTYEAHRIGLSSCKSV